MYTHRNYCAKCRLPCIITGEDERTPLLPRSGNKDEDDEDDARRPNEDEEVSTITVKMDQQFHFLAKLENIKCFQEAVDNIRFNAEGLSSLMTEYIKNTLQKLNRVARFGASMAKYIVPTVRVVASASGAGAINTLAMQLKNALVYRAFKASDPKTLVTI